MHTSAATGNLPARRSAMLTRPPGPMCECEHPPRQTNSTPVHTAKPDRESVTSPLSAVARRGCSPCRTPPVRNLRQYRTAHRISRTPMPIKLSILCALAAVILAAADFPQAEISNGSIRAKLYLPDAQQGYYRATRFDWSGQIASLEFQGHNYFGQWFDRYDPKLHDSILGPVEEFLTNGIGLGYNDVKTGESFVKIGVGALCTSRKSEPSNSSRLTRLPIRESGPSISFPTASNSPRSCATRRGTPTSTRRRSA